MAAAAASAPSLPTAAELEARGYFCGLLDKKGLVATTEHFCALGVEKGGKAVWLYSFPGGKAKLEGQRAEKVYEVKAAEAGGDRGRKRNFLGRRQRRYSRCHVTDDRGDTRRLV